jgi:ABC-type lipoprotein release transport system permease subunit
MNVLNRIAWRNVWRNPRRSAVLVGAVAIGMFAYVGAVSLMDGFSAAMIETNIELQGGHIQVAAEGYNDNPRIFARLGDASAMAASLEAVGGATAAPVVATPAMASSAARAAGVIVRGVDPVREQAVSDVAARVVEGAFLQPGELGHVVIGERLAEQLDVQLGERLVLMATDLDNEVNSGAYRVAGLFRTASTDFDRSVVYLGLEDAQRLVGYGPEEVSAFTIRLAPGTPLMVATSEARDALVGRGAEVLTWRDRSPMLVIAETSYDYSALLLVVILFTGVAFTLANSFLMVILERIHEIGVMLAGGVQPRQVRRMLYLEAFYVVAIGAALGLGLASALMAYWGAHGLSLAAFADALGAIGLSPVVYPVLDWGRIGTALVLVLVIVFLAVLYPAVKASRYDPVEAINHV